MFFIPDHDLPSANRQQRLARRPDGSPVASDFALAEAPVPDPADGEVLVRNLYLSADPVQRGWMARPDVQQVGETVRALGVGIVVKSRIDGIAEGDIVYGIFGWQDYAAASRSDILAHVGTPRVAVSAYAGALGMPGVTAWLALNDIAPPKPGQTVLVSTAAGTVGSMVGQIAARAGARPIGLTGSDEKVALCTSHFGYAAAYNYKTCDLGAVLAEASPDGFDTFYDNTGGPILDTAMRHMKRYGRIIACGTAATPSWTPPPTGLRNEREILMRALTWTGFVIFDHADRFEAAVKELSELAATGAFHFEEDIDTGMAAVPDALPAILTGKNKGKKLIFIGRD
ncbi:NADP-dependent oxidoreductase [Croceicoccus mobilis]|uniref:NADP-dependent oxidoreductase n=1 Tax=Croceicoccus mobilis TaxID=1703339 RepID=A0A916Z8Q4_9SPHN|nr:NADP-dependent oxidoreductase [Croceicoccus mobilis]GGD80061.1 NADP-dependent oxidoreductase [Croceicoccus mobilis]